jgi:hypothetical protein
VNPGIASVDQWFVINALSRIGGVFEDDVNGIGPVRSMFDHYEQVVRIRCIADGNNR